MRVLQICPKPPFPTVDGASIAANNLTAGLIALGHSVKVLALETPKHRAVKTVAEEDYVRRTQFESVFVDTSVTVSGALSSIVRRRSYNIERFYSKTFERKIVACLKDSDYDVIQLESIYVAPYVRAIRSATRAPIVCRSHNIEYEIWRGLQQSSRNPLRKLYLGHLARGLERYERNCANAFDGIAAITDADAATLRRLGGVKPIETIPFGLNLGDIESRRRPKGPTVFHLGSMDWLPNQEGIQWFLDAVWPQVRRRHPDAELHLAGRAMPDWISTLDTDGLHVAGEVDNAYDFMASKAVMIVPLQSGGGMRIKIVEGLALAKPIVSTTLGACGIDYTDGKNIMIADDASSFARKIGQLLADDKLSAALASNAKRLAFERYDNGEICKKLAAFYACLAASKESSQDCSISAAQS